MLGLCSDLRTRPYGPVPPYFAVVLRGGDVVAAAMRTPPFQAVLSSIDDQAAIPLLVEDLLVAHPDLSGVLGRTDDARRFARFDRGRRFCFLFTDLANPTSNKIYQAIGYEPVCDVDEYRFEARPAH